MKEMHKNNIHLNQQQNVNKREKWIYGEMYKWLKKRLLTEYIGYTNTGVLIPTIVYSPPVFCDDVNVFFFLAIGLL